MSLQWKMICLMLLEFLRQLLEIPPDQNHQPTAAAALKATEALIEGAKQ